MKRRASRAPPAITAMAAAMVLASPAAGWAQAAKDHPRNQCFYITQFEQWRDLDDKTIYIRVNLNDYYRLDMAQSCPELTYPNPHLITHTMGPDTVCGPLDWDLRVAPDSGPGSFGVPCIVKAMTKLTPAEAAAIPKKFKP